MSSEIEVEKKARVADPEGMEKRLWRIGRPVGEIDYSDTYFTYSHVAGYTDERFRLREHPGGARVTAKEEMEGGDAEVSLEREFEVDDPEAFRGFAKMFGFRVLIEKRKRGKRFALNSVQDKESGPFAELVEVEGLGWFIEIEVMVKDRSEVEGARRGIGRAFQELGVKDSSFEPRPYTLMLYELKHGSGDG